ncbi:unnamed protein product [Calypogeia fissa]
MQFPSAAARVAIRGSYSALFGLKTFSRRPNQLSTESPRAVASRSSPIPPSHSPLAVAAGEEQSSKDSSTMVDGKLSYRVRKRRQPAVVNEKEKASGAAEFLAPNPPPSTDDDLPSGSPSVVYTADVTTITQSSSRRQSARVLKRVLEAEEQKLEVKKSLGATELSVSRTRTVRKASRKNAAAAPAAPMEAQEAAEVDLSALPVTETATTTDFWLSSLSESSASKSGADAVVKDLVVEAAIMSPIISGKTLFAAEELAKALEHLKSADPLLKTVIEMHDAPKFEKCESAFTALCRSIVFQQLATKAASVIFGRLVTLCEGLDNLTPTTISQLSAEQMREIGISGRKASYLHDLAANFLSGALSDSSIYDMDDESLIKALIAVKGIGMWSVHMFMLFSLHKPDVLPVSDLGIRKGLQKLYKLKDLPNPDQAEKIAASWQPYRSLGAWYIWRVLSNTPIVKVAD